jgi:hypothetical protein
VERTARVWFLGGCLTLLLVVACGGAGGEPVADTGRDAAAGDALAAGDAEPDTTPDGAADDAVRADALPDAAGRPDVAHDAARDVAPEDGAPDVPPDAAPDVTADVTPDTWVDPYPDTVFVFDPPLAATGFFRAEQRDGRWWLVTPEGEPFYSVGINAATPGGSVDRQTGRNPYGEAVDALYADDAAWAAEAARRLRSWGFNTVGAWSASDRFRDEGLPYTVILYMSGADWQSGYVPDYFSDEFEARCADIAAREVAPRAGDPLLVGWFIDNELRWGADWRVPRPLLEDYLELPEGAPGRLVAESFEGDAGAFLEAAAERFFEVTTTAIRAADPNHLVLGVRAISVLTPPEVPPAAAPWLDVFSVNHYEFLPIVLQVLAAFDPRMAFGDWLRPYHETTGLPILVTEFSYRAADAGVPSTWPPHYPTLPTQAERAAAFAGYVGRCYRSPWIVGHHWFQYFDEPPGGRFDGENSNFGLVSNDDTPWQVLTDRMAREHADAPHHHR